MAGNVSEWCSSRPWAYPYLRADGREDLNATGARTLRGGSWFNDLSYLRCGYRIACFPTVCDGDVGFRCVVSAEAK